MDFYIFDRDLNRIGILKEYKSVIWNRRYSKCGSFQIHCSFSKDMFKKLAEGNIVWKHKSSQAGFIEYQEIDLDENGKEILIVKGRLMLGYLDSRIVWGIASLDGTVEGGIRQLVLDNAINPTDADRKIPLLELAPLNNFIDKFKKQISHKNLLNTIEDIAHEFEYGLSVNFNAIDKKLAFEVYKGLNRSYSQNINKRVFFSPDIRNVLKQNYQINIRDYRNVALIGGEGEGDDRKFESIGEYVGLDRKEAFVDARDIRSEKSGTTMSDSEYRELLKEEGKQKLSELMKNQNFDSDIDLESNFKYEEDFDLGDTVTILNKRWGITIDMRITEVEEVYEDFKKVYVTFGNALPTLQEKIRREVI